MVAEIASGFRARSMGQPPAAVLNASHRGRRDREGVGLLGATLRAAKAGVSRRMQMALKKRDATRIRRAPPAFFAGLAAGAPNSPLSGGCHAAAPPAPCLGCNSARRRRGSVTASAAALRARRRRALGRRRRRGQATPGSFDVVCPGRLLLPQPREARRRALISAPSAPSM